MSLVTPWLAVAGLLAIAIPIAIHLLLRLRRRPVPWGAMRLLREAMRETARRRRLEHLLVLALRCLLVALLGLALAQPLLRGGGAVDATGGRVVVLVIDDGLVSATRPDPADPRRSALSQSTERAAELVAGLRPGDAVGVIGLARPARSLLLPPTTDHAAALTLLSSMRPQETPADLAQGLALLEETMERLGPERSVVAYLLGESRGGSVDLQAALPTAFAEADTRRLRLLVEPPATDPVANVQIVGVEPLRSLLVPGQTDGSGLVVVRLQRQGPLEPAVTRVTVDGDVRPVAPRTVRWEHGQSEASVEFLLDPMSAESGAIGLSVAIDEDAMPGDDRRHVVLETRRRIAVSLLDRRAFGAVPAIDRLGAGQWILRALDPDRTSPMEITVEDPAALGPAALRGADAIVVTRPDLLDDLGWEQLRRRLAVGGMAVITPPEELNVHLWADRLGPLLGVPWRVGIEPRDLTDTAAEGAGDGAGLALAERQPETPLLRLLAGEVGDLARPVRVLRTLPISLEAGGDPLLVGADGTVLAASATPRDADGRSLPGVVVLLGFAPDLSWTNLPAKPMMVPLFQELVRQGIGVATEAQRLLVGETPLMPVGGAELVRRDGDGAGTAIDPARGGGLRRSGLYRIDDVGGQSMGLLAVNVDLGAARTDPVAGDALLAWLRTSGPWSYLDPGDPLASLRTVEMAAPISGVLLILALACAVLESILARRFSRAERRTVDGAAPSGIASLATVGAVGGRS